MNTLLKIILVTVAACFYVLLSASMTSVLLQNKGKKLAAVAAVLKIVEMFVVARIFYLI